MKLLGSHARMPIALFIPPLISLTAALAHAQFAVPGDHYLGYTAKPSAALGATKLPSTLSKQLQDQFRTATCAVKKEVALYNPATKNNEAPGNPTVHQVGYKIKCATPFTLQTHTVFDQFFPNGVSVTVKAPDSLLAPSGKSDDATVEPAAPLANVVDHFLCYKATGPKLALLSPSVSDQFFPNAVTVVLKRITKLCAPVNKNGESPGAQDHLGHLLCYQLKLPTGVKFTKRNVRTNNTNFGANPLAVTAVKELCVPAHKDSIPGPTRTAQPGAPTNTPTRTPVPGGPTSTPTRTPTGTFTPQPGGCTDVQFAQCGQSGNVCGGSCSSGQVCVWTGGECNCHPSCAACGAEPVPVCQENQRWCSGVDQYCDPHSCSCQPLPTPSSSAPCGLTGNMCGGTCAASDLVCLWTGSSCSCVNAFAGCDFFSCRNQFNPNNWCPGVSQTCNLATCTCEP